MKHATFAAFFSPFSLTGPSPTSNVGTTGSCPSEFSERACTWPGWPHYIEKLMFCVKKTKRYRKMVFGCNFWQFPAQVDGTASSWVASLDSGTWEDPGNCEELKLWPRYRLLISAKSAMFSPKKTKQLQYRNGWLSLPTARSGSYTSILAGLLWLRRSWDAWKLAQSSS